MTTLPSTALESGICHGCQTKGKHF
jgi:hypothetical protein